jgi:feruloyl esterase
MGPSHFWKPLAILALGCKTLTAASFGHSRCSALATSLRIENATILATGYYQNGSIIDLPGLTTSCVTGTGPPTVNATTDLCRVVVSVATTSTSRVLVEAWLPDEWNSRLIASGGGGISGCVDYNAVPYGASLGFASFGTNGGHNGSVGYDFFLYRPEVINDFGHRSIHIEAQVGKQIVQQYYGRSSSYNYYAGCSTGGRQGIKDATMYPDDFDGILAGSPGVHWFNIVSAYALLARRSGWPDINSTSYVQQAQWEAIVAAQINLLDPLDGVIDGVIDQAYMYNFDVELLRCGGGLLNDTVCLSPDQVASVRAVYQPISNSHGQFAFPSWGLGADTSGWSANVVNGMPSINYVVEVRLFPAQIIDDVLANSVYSRMCSEASSTMTVHGRRILLVK